MKKTILSLSLIIFGVIGTIKVNAQLTTTSQWNTLTTSFGNIQFGPASSNGYSEIYTTQSKFLFNKDIYSSTGGFSALSSNLSFKTNGITRMSLLNSNGFVGIGTSAPTEMLQVNGNLLINRLKLGTLNSGTGYFTIANVVSSRNTYAHYQNSLYFNVGDGINTSATTLGLLSDGSVTIGVWQSYSSAIANTQGNKLMVNGGILCEKIKVIGDVPNSDHVFTPSYKLRTLEEVKEYVWTNKHLPEIPSAQEFKDNGYNVGEMDDLLLRKVEELTLYVIKLNEEVEKLKVENEKLTNKVNK